MHVNVRVVRLYFQEESFNGNVKSSSRFKRRLNCLLQREPLHLSRDDRFNQNLLLSVQFLFYFLNGITGLAFRPVSLLCSSCQTKSVCVWEKRKKVKMDPLKTKWFIPLSGFSHCEIKEMNGYIRKGKKVRKEKVRVSAVHQKHEHEWRLLYSSSLAVPVQDQVCALTG